MTPTDSALILAAGALSSVGLAGLLARGRAERCLAFAAYLGCVAASNLTIALVLRENTWQSWLVTETLQALLAVAIALEVAARMLARMPSAAAAARRTMLGLLALTGAAILASLAATAPTLRGAPSLEALAYVVASSVLPLLTYGAAFLFTALLGLANFYVLPLDPLHRVVLVGFSVYLVLFSALLISASSNEVRAALSSAMVAASLTLLGVWSWAAWRHEEAPPAPEAVVRRLWPWH